MRRTVVTGVMMADSTRSSPAIRRRRLSSKSSQVDGVGVRVHGPGLCSGDTGARSRKAPSAATPATPSAIAWCIFMNKPTRPPGRPGGTTSPTRAGCGPADGDAASRRHKAAASRHRGRRPGRPRHVRRCRRRKRRPTVASPTRIGASTELDGSGEGSAPVARSARGRLRSGRHRRCRAAFSRRGWRVHRCPGANPSLRARSA